MILAGLPATTQLSGTSFITTLPAPISTLLPMVILPMILTFAPMLTLSPKMGKSLLPMPLLPIVVSWQTVKFLPILFAPRVVLKGWFST